MGNLSPFVREKEEKHGGLGLLSLSYVHDSLRPRSPFIKQILNGRSTYEGKVQSVAQNLLGG